MEFENRFNKFQTKKIERKDIVYNGLFVNDIQELIKKFPPKHGRIFAHHSTVGAGNLDGIEVGKKYLIKIIGRAYDDQGDALLIENPKSKSQYPHITLSCAEGVKPIYSFKLFQKAERDGTIEYFNLPEEIEITEGYFDGKKAVLERGVYEITDKKN